MIDTIHAINALSDKAFMERFGALMEHSPQFVEQAAGKRPFRNASDMQMALMDAVYNAGTAAQLELLQAHPRLANKVAMTRGLTSESAAEQASAGLDRLSPEMFERFHQLNKAYDDKFGFPFIICVRLTNVAGILEAMQQRLKNSREQEIKTGLEEVGKIVGLRLNDALKGM